MKRLVVIVALVFASAPAFGFGILAEPPAATASMVWLGLVGLAIAGSPRGPSDPPDSSADG